MERQTFGTAGVGPKPDVLLPAIVKSCELPFFSRFNPFVLVITSTERREGKWREQSSAG